jgi:hypothetical protein
MATPAHRFWQLTRSRWRPRPGPRRPGYSLLVPVPGDLPVFLELALTVCGRLNAANRAETLVVPDRPTAAVEQVIARAAPTWAGPLRAIRPRAVDRWLMRRLGNPHINHWLQWLNGAEQAAAGFALIHDADAFLFEADLFERQYRTCLERGLVCLGVNPVWDDWFAWNGLRAAATWELLFDTDWARSFAPADHKGHVNTVNGRTHSFDNTIYPQCLTPPERVGVEPLAGGFVHFNYVICTYRFFQAAKGPCEDEHFRLLLIRLLIDAFDRSGWRYDLPPLAELVRGLTDARAPVTYRAAATAGHYSEFRGKLRTLMSDGLTAGRPGEVIRNGVAPFDRAFGWAG